MMVMSLALGLQLPLSFRRNIGPARVTSAPRQFFFLYQSLHPTFNIINIQTPDQQRKANQAASCQRAHLLLSCVHIP
jgi:hypothetical protein